MLSKELINHNTPRLQLQDSVIKAKQIISDFKLTHLPVVSENKFLGLISEEDLLDVEEDKLSIEIVQSFFTPEFIYDDMHFLNALNFCNQFETNVVPVLNRANEYIGMINAIELLKIMGDFAGANEIGGLIILEMERAQFSISEISRIVESGDCTVLHLNTTIQAVTGILTVTLHINKREIASIVSTFERYEYTVKYHFGIQSFEDKTDVNYKNLMNYLDL